MVWEVLDAQLARWSVRLEGELKIPDGDSRKLATCIASEIRFLPKLAKEQVAAASLVPLAERIRELQAFQGWMELVPQLPSSPFITRAQVITQNYICFVYLPESCFRLLSRISPVETATRKCAQFLVNNPVRAFRNAIAHANWAYREDFRAIVF